MAIKRRYMRQGGAHKFVAVEGMDAVWCEFCGQICYNRGNSIQVTIECPGNPKEETDNE